MHIIRDNQLFIILIALKEDAVSYYHPVFFILFFHPRCVVKRTCITVMH